MGVWLSNLDPQFLLLTVNSVLLIALLGLIFNLRRQYQSDAFADLFESAMLRITQSQTQSQAQAQANLDTKITDFQQRLFSAMLDDREKQLHSLTQLRVELEQRFAASSLTTSENFQEFKNHMVERFEQLKSTSARSLNDGQQQIANSVHQFGEKIQSVMTDYQQQTRQTIDEQMRKGVHELRVDLDRSSRQQNEVVNQSIAGLTERTDERLKEISGQVEKRLAEGFDKTTQTFNDVLKRLALIDDAQKKIAELSGNVVSLQEILNDKRSRGAFGEIQLKGLISNIMPNSHYRMQHKLSNDKIADCMLFLPEPTGSIAIDAKFPLESYKRKTDVSAAESDRKEASKQFMRDIRKHINDIADKYILPPETSEGAVMFIPAESVFAEIHGHYPELVEFAYQRKVWMVSPTTLMAILTTAAAVIKDEQTRKQVHIIKEHLAGLGRDFVRFQGRMDNLSKHIGQVHKDVEQVHVSARKISSRFERIEKVDLSKEKPAKTAIAIEPLISTTEALK
jgi:DNA recombination protein RmuC